MQPDYTIKHHPVDLSRHGKNPYGRSLYRVVWADSRMSKVQCRGKMHTLPRYVHEPETRGKWILERWVPAEVLLGMSREKWDEMLAANPNAAAEAYPEKGDYEIDRIFDEDSGPWSRTIDEVALHKQIAFHLWTKETESAAERAQAEADAKEKLEKQKEEKFDALYEEAREETECSKA